jgi:hypothetical protein
VLQLHQVNMLALYNIGPAVEAVLGGNRFLALYLGSAVGGNLLSCMLGSGFSTSMGSSGEVLYIYCYHLYYNYILYYNMTRYYCAVGGNALSCMLGRGFSTSMGSSGGQMKQQFIVYY